jgi:hypothetical protein
MEHMENERQWILENAPLLSHRRVASDTRRIGGEWKLHEIEPFHSTERNIEFRFVLLNDINRLLSGDAKIDRASATLSNVKLEEISLS